MVTSLLKKQQKNDMSTITIKVGIVVPKTGRRVKRKVATAIVEAMSESLSSSIQTSISTDQ